MLSLCNNTNNNGMVYNNRIITDTNHIINMNSTNNTNR